VSIISVNGRRRTHDDDDGDENDVSEEQERGKNLQSIVKRNSSTLLLFSTPVRFIQLFKRSSLENGFKQQPTTTTMSENQE
jgi:hypothetical protein